MNPSPAPQDDPFDHAALARYGTGESSSNLLGHNNKPAASEVSHDADSYYNQPEGSRTSSYDPEKVEAESKAGEYARDRSYQDLGAWSDDTMEVKRIEDGILDYSDAPFNDERALPLPEKASPFSRLFAGNRNSLQQRIEQKKRGIGRQRYPFVGTSWLFFAPGCWLTGVYE